MLINSGDTRFLTLIKDFYELTKMKTLVYDADGQEICFYPARFTPFCEYLRSHECLDAACRECDMNAIATCRRTQQPIIYTCHAGLTEGIAPIVVNNSILGFIAIGQIKEPDSLLSVNDFADSNKLEQLFNELPIIDRKVIESAMHVLEACAAYEQLKTLVEESSNSFSSRLLQFIDNNLTGNLDIDTLLRQFSMSRVELYRNVDFSFKCTPAELIKNRRLHRASKLLRTTNTPVNKIAILSGLPDYNYFSKIFKKKYGISPTQYRIEKT